MLWPRRSGKLVADPIEGEEGTFEATNFPERLGQSILLGIGREPLHQRRRSDGSGLDRRREAQRLIPVFADDPKIDGSANHGSQRGIGGAAVDRIESAIGEVADTR